MSNRGATRLSGPAKCPALPAKATCFCRWSAAEVSRSCGVQLVLASADPGHRYDDPVISLGNLLLLSPR